MSSRSCAQVRSFASKTILKTTNLYISGDGGLDELTEDFNPSKIQYAFLKVEDPKTSLPKFVLINWQVSESANPLISPTFEIFQGESAPGTRKGTCSMHIRDIGERCLLKSTWTLKS